MSDQSFSNLNVSNTLVVNKRIVANTFDTKSVVADTVNIKNTIIENGDISNLTSGKGNAMFKEITVDGNITSLTGNIKANVGKVEANNGLQANTGGITVVGSTTINGETNLTGVFQNTGTMSVVGTQFIGGNISTESGCTLSVAGDSNFQKNVNVQNAPNKFSVSGLSSFSDLNTGNYNNTTSDATIIGPFKVSGDGLGSGNLSTAKGLVVNSGGAGFVGDLKITGKNASDGFVSSNAIGEYSFVPYNTTLTYPSTTVPPLPSQPIRLINIQSVGYFSTGGERFSIKISGSTAITPTSTVFAFITNQPPGSYMQFCGVSGLQNGELTVNFQERNGGQLGDPTNFTITIWILN